MTAKACTINVTSFDLSKAMTFSKIFSRVKLSPSARLVLRCLVDFWNPKKGLVYPGQNTIADCTGITTRSVVNAVEELRRSGLVLTTGNNGERLKYYFSRTFFDLAGISQGCEKLSQVTTENFSPHEQHEPRTNNKQNKNLTFQKHLESVRYISSEATRKQLNETLKRDDKSPYNDLETALKYIQDLSSQMHNDLIRKQVCKIKRLWNLQ